MPWELDGVIDRETLNAGLASLDTLARLRREIDGIRSPTLQIAALEVGNYMRDQLLRDSDWASMAHSLELRVPLVDVPLFRRVLELRASGIDCSKAAACGSASADALKLIAGRRKTGFGIPISSWMRHLGMPPRVSGHPMRAWAIMVASRGFSKR
jgi:asparagine synthase (glutamine-hydrolysing)